MQRVIKFRSHKTKRNLQKVKRNLMTWDQAKHQRLLNAQAREFMDQDGNTPLHYFLSRFNKLSQLKEMLASYGDEDISVMSRTVNNLGQLPYDNFLSHNKNLSGDEKHEACLILEKLMIKNDLKKSCEPVTVKEIVQRYSDVNPRLKANLLFGLKVINETRQIVKESYTHPQANAYPREDQNRIAYFINEMRKTYPPSSLREIYFNAVIEKVKQNNIGNCFEHALMSLQIVTEKNKLAYGTTFSLENGDHSFLTMNIYPAIWEFKFNGDVVIDSIYGDLFPAYEIPYRLYGFEKRPSVNNSCLRILTNLNLKYHSFNDEFSVNGKINLPDFKKQNSFYKNEITNTVTLFKSVEKNEISNSKVNKESVEQKPSIKS